MHKIVGIDYGARRVGVAVSDDGRMVAFPRTVLPNDEHLMDALASLAEEEQVERFVVGESDNPAGGLNTIARRIAIFAEALKVRTGKAVELVSEAYSSAEARRVFEEEVARGRHARRPVVDAAAAAIILQLHLDKLHTAAH